MKVPGILYSIILALAAWAVEYFSGSGAGGAWPLAPILLAAIPIALKLVTVQTTPDPTDPDNGATARGFDAPPQSSKTRRFLLG